MTVVMNELAKIRHLRIGVIAIIHLVAVVGGSLFMLVTTRFNTREA